MVLKRQHNMLNEHYSTLLDYVDRFMPTERCWDEQGFHPESVAEISEADLMFVAAAYCYDYFITNGLFGMLECEWGKMVPEFVLFLKVLGCDKSAGVLADIVELHFDGKIPRNDRLRARLVDHEDVFKDLHGRCSEDFDKKLSGEQFAERINSHSKSRCVALGLKVSGA